MRLKSNARWMDLPGVECAYQSIGAPSAVDALLNVAHDHRSVGKYAAMPGVLPTWSGGKGWKFNGIDQYLRTAVAPSQSTTMIVRYSDFTMGSLEKVPCGSRNFGYNGMFIGCGSTSGTGYMLNGGILAYYAWNGNHVAAIAGKFGYVDGLLIGAIGAGTNNTTQDAYIGTFNNNGVPASYWFDAPIPSFLIASRTLTPAEVFLASRQMAYCEQNPDWNAWARRRRYYYAPSAAAGRVGIYGRRGVVALPGGVSIRGTD